MGNYIFPKYPKIWNLGSPEITNLFKGPVEITEKLDGSQLRFGKDLGGNLRVGSKRIDDIHLQEKIDPSFVPAVEYIKLIEKRIKNGEFFIGEWFAKPKQNCLSYSKTPSNGIALFGWINESGRCSDWAHLREVAAMLGVDVVPRIFQGEINSPSELEDFLKRDSYLGGEKIEGLVIKNYAQESNSQYSRECYGKLVSQRFRERNKMANPKGKDQMEAFFQTFHTEARFEKAFQHLRDEGKITYELKDLGPLFIEVQQDILDEETKLIKDTLFNLLKKRLLKSSTVGLPDWYKKKLLEKQFKGEKHSEIPIS